MAGTNPNYERGEMDIEDHSETFGGFMSMSVYGGAAIIVTLLFPILVFGVNLAWPAALLTTLVLGVIIGVVMKFKAQWYAVLVGMALFLGVAIGLLSLLF
ncbi:MAG: aa3-type cytochrome c oxidase subunit IV [Litorimonas sp.]